ncbi:cytochrome c biogenesis protein ResB [Catenulispora yoronensis]|uniref:Cytochrome c biogenesis protein ResB n=1 Tax=Catenulispora yoronensis TaxID=450799 RepID=A0ABP5F1K2_9ACTN
MASPTEEMDAESLSTAPREDSGPVADGSVTLPRLGRLELLRWAWRQLTSMRVALILLFMLSLAAIPGSLLPQRSANTDASLATKWIADHRTLGPWLDRLQFFTVYKSVWFSSIYLLLFVSLIGCIIPRSWQHYKAVRKPPPAAPRNLARMPAHYRWTDASGTSVGTKLDTAEAVLRKKRFRVVRGTDAAGGGWVSAERGYLREVGNLVFHLSLVGVLAGFAVKGYFGYQGKVLVNEGETFNNIGLRYDDRDFGGGVDPDGLPAFSLKLDRFDARYETSRKAGDYGQPRDFTADVTYRAAGSATEKHKTVKTNVPITVNGVSLYLVSHGYSPVITVRNSAGTVVYSGPVKYFESGAMFKSSGMLRVNDGIKDKDGKATELGVDGTFLPVDGGMSPTMGPVSDFPAAYDPALIVNVYIGDLGDVPSVYRFDESKAQHLRLTADKNNFAAKLNLVDNKTVQLPDGIGSVTFDGFKEYAQFDINHDPSKTLVLVSAVGIVGGLVLSLGIRRRRVFVRVKPAGDEAIRVEVAGLARAEDARLRDEVRGVGRGLRPAKVGAQK